MKGEILKSLRQKHALESLIGKQRNFIDLVHKLRKVAHKNVSILLIGETGTGKGRCAQFIHQYGDRFSGPFISYNCGSGPVSLFESRLFGHVKGAFTGAYANHPGLVEEANGGVLFLDEINSLDAASQVKLNHFLETGSFRRLGENCIRKADVRVVAASNVDLRTNGRKGAFRDDLYYRLAEYELHIPPLRGRKQDIELLAQHFIKKNQHLSPHGELRLSSMALNRLKNYDWPGNVRELENVIKRAIIDASSDVVDTVICPHIDNHRNAPEDFLETMPWKQAKQHVVSSFEKRYLRALLRRYGGTVAKCARHAGVQPPDFWKLMRKYDIKPQDFR